MLAHALEGHTRNNAGRVKAKKNKEAQRVLKLQQGTNVDKLM
jgi:hypothetical protein